MKKGLALLCLVLLLAPSSVFAQQRGVRVIEENEEDARTPGSDCDPRGVGVDIVRTSDAEYYCDDSAGADSATWAVRPAGAASAGGDPADIQFNVSGVLTGGDENTIDPTSRELRTRTLNGRHNVSKVAGVTGSGTSGDPYIGWESVCTENGGFHFDARPDVAQTYYATSTGCVVDITDNGNPNTNTHGTIISGDGQDRVVIRTTADVVGFGVEASGVAPLTIERLYIPGGFTVEAGVAHTTNPLIRFKNLDDHFTIANVRGYTNGQTFAPAIMEVVNSQNGEFIGPNLEGEGTDSSHSGPCLKMEVDDGIQRGNITILGGHLYYCGDGVQITTGGTGIFNLLNFVGTKVLHSTSNAIDGSKCFDLDSNSEQVNLWGIQCERFETCIDADGVTGLAVRDSLLSLCRNVADTQGTAVKINGPSEGTVVDNVWFSGGHDGLVIDATANQAITYRRARIVDMSGDEVSNSSTSDDALLIVDGGDLTLYKSTYDVDKSGNEDAVEWWKRDGSGVQEWRSTLVVAPSGPQWKMFDAADAPLGDVIAFDVSNDYSDIPRLRVAGSADGSAIEFGVLGDGVFRNGGVSVIRDDVSGDYQLMEFDKLTSTVRDWRIRVQGSDTLFKIDAYDSANLFVAPVIRWNASSEWSEIDTLRLGGNVDGAAITLGVTGDTTLRGDVSQVENLTVKEDVTVGSDTTTSSGELLLHGKLGTPAIPPNNRGGAIGFASAGSTIGCYQESNAQGVIVWDTSRLTHGTTDLGNASINCSTGRSTLGDQLTLIGSDPTIKFDGSTILYQIVANETIGWDGFMFTAGLGFGTAPPTEGFFGKVNALDATEPNVESWKTDSAITDGEEVTAFVFRGTDTLTNSATDYGAAIRAVADADWGDAADNNDMPTRLEVKVQNDGASDGLAAAHTTFKSDGDLDVVAGDVLIADDYMLRGGSRQTFCSANKASIAVPPGEHYMRGPGDNWGPMTATRGWPLGRDGSVIAVWWESQTNGNSSDTVDFECRVNGTMVLEDQTTPPSGGMTLRDGKVYQDPGVDTFSAGDVLQMAAVANGSTGAYSEPWICCEVVWHD